MRSLLVILFLISLSLTASSQTFTLGPKGGINYSSIVINETFTSEGVDFTYATQEAKVAPVFGGFLRLNLGSFFIQPEALWSQDKSEIKLSSANFSELHTLKINKIDIPIMAGFTLAKAIRFYGGPVISYIQDAKLEGSEKVFESFAHKYEDKTLGYQAGLGFDISRLSFDFRYGSNLSDLATSAVISGEEFNFDTRKQTIQATVGIKLFK